MLNRKPTVTATFAKMNQPIPEAQASVENPPALVQGNDFVIRESKISLLVEEIRGLMYQHLQSTFEIGRRLAELRQMADDGRWIRELDRLGIGADWAEKRIRLFEKVSQLPTLKELANTNIQKALCLIQEADETTIQAIAGDRQQIDAIDKLSIRELKTRIRKLEGDNETVIEEAIKEQKAEVKSAMEQLRQLQAETHSDHRACLKTARQLRDLSEQVSALAHQLINQMGALDRKHAPIIANDLTSILSGVYTLAQQNWALWNERQTELGLVD